jgi:hypothetical protein
MQIFKERIWKIGYICTLDIYSCDVCKAENILRALFDHYIIESEVPYLIPREVFYFNSGTEQLFSFILPLSVN